MPVIEQLAGQVKVPIAIDTVKPGVAVLGFGYIGLEEDILVTEDGAVFLGDPQTEIITH